MNVEPIQKSLRGVLDFTLFRIGSTPLTVATLGMAVVTILLTFVVSSVARRFVRKRLPRTGPEARAGGSVAALLHYAILAVGFSIAVQTIGINLSALFAAGAVFAIGLGFAMQNIAQNFVAGVIILLERTIRPGDIIEIEGQVARVLEIGIRSTRVRTRFDVDIIVPNATLVQTNVKNYTLDDSDYRVHVQVGVSYSSDVPQVVEVLRKCAFDVEWRVKERDPIVLVTTFGDSAVMFEVSVWCNDPWSARLRQSDLSLCIWDALKRAQIVIAFPQLDVHLDPGLEKIAKSRS